jgi:hypothetical protein
MPQAKTKREKTTEFVQAKEAATGSVDGEPFVLTPNELFAADHPIVRAYPDFFKPLEDPHRQRPEVEQATAAPGEKRGG